MSDSSSTSTYLFIVFTLATLFCGGLVVWSFASGTYVDSTTVTEDTFEQESFSRPHMTFELDSTTTVQLSVEGTTLDDSWVWVKTVLADSENRVLADYSFEMAEYSDEDDDSWSQAFILPPGSYKVLVHGKDAKRNKGWTDEHREEVRIEVQKGFILTRYGLIGFVLFAIGAFWSLASSGSGSSEESGFD